MTVLMIGFGEEEIYKNVGASYERQKRYADQWGTCVLLLCNRSSTLAPLHDDNLFVYPLNAGKSIFILWYGIRKYLTLRKKYKFDVITTQDPFLTAILGIIFKFMDKIPLHVQNHSSFINNQIWISERPFIFKILNKVAKWTLRKADRLRVVNSTEKDIYISQLGIDPKKTDLAPVPVDTSFWKVNLPINEKLAFLKKYNIVENKNLIGWAGRFAKLKNLDFLFECYANIKKIKPETKLLLAGDFNNSYYDLGSMEIKYDVKPIYLGLLNKSELKCFYKSIEVYLHTSNYEGFGNVVADAQANGVPVVSTNVAGSRDILVEGETGFIVDYQAFNFSEAVIGILNDQNLRLKLQENALANMEIKYDYETMESNIVNSVRKTANNQN